MVVILLVMSGVVYAFMSYQAALKPVDRYDDTPEIVTIEQGTSDEEIARLLEQRGLINSAIAYNWYVRIGGHGGDVQAGSYSLSKSMSVEAIVKKLASGEVAVELVTILPAKRLDEIKQRFVEEGYSQEEVNNALEPTQYAEHPALRDKPPTDSLEGYLYPESFQKTASTPLKVIIESALDQMALVLTKDYEEAIAKKGLSLHQAVILASIVEREVSSEADRAKVAQVFLKRFAIDMPLGSDPTALYGALQAGIEPSVFADTPYNTRLYVGLPPGPINNVGASSLTALLEPADTDYLYFVSGDDGVTRFSRTLEEHEALTAQYCIELCKSY